MARKFLIDRVPTISAKRSSFDLSRKLMLSMNVGKLYPVGKPYEVYPGDTFKIRTKFVARLTSSYLKPVMEDLVIEFYHFFVPHRIVYRDVPNGADHQALVRYNFQAVMGENKLSSWAPSANALIPTLPAFTCVSGSVADYLEFPLGANPAGLQVLPFRGFAAIYDQWYRDQNNVDPMYIYYGYRSNSTAVLESTPNSKPWSQNNYTGMLPTVTKSPDYFTRALPSPQKGDAVDFLAGAGVLPVVTYTDLDILGNHPSLKLRKSGVGVGDPQPVSYSYMSTTSDGFLDGLTGTGSPTFPYQGSEQGGSYPSNLGADLSAAGLSINDFRVAISLQRMLEKDAVGGTRYKEILRAHWGVTSPDARLDDTELLGGVVQKLAIQQVPQTTGSGLEGDNTLGALAAYSWTDGEGYMTKGFVEHGYLFTCACIKQARHSYSYGVPKQYERVSRTDFYDPCFANLGMLPIWKENIYANGVSKIKDQVFGYREAWDELRTEYNGAVGQARPNSQSNFELYNFVDEYANSPTLNQSFVEETPAYVDRTLAVPSSTADQFLVDVYFDTIAYRALPVYSNASKVGGGFGIGL